MNEINREKLFSKLGPVGFNSLENAVDFCKIRGNPYVELVHWLHQIYKNKSSDVYCISVHYLFDFTHLAADIVRALERLPVGASSISDLSYRLDDIMENSWKFTSLLFDSSSIRTGYILYTVLTTRHLKNELLAISSEFKKIDIDDLAKSFMDITRNSAEKNTVDENSLSSVAEETGWRCIRA